MRIALFTDTFTPHINGVARTLQRLANHAALLGHEIAVIAPTARVATDYRSALDIRLAGVTIPFYPELKLARMLTPSESRKVAVFRPDIVHVATEFTIGWAGIAWAEQNGVPVVSSFHTDFPAYVRAYGMPALERVAWRYLRGFHAHARLTFCPSAATLEDLTAHGFSGPIQVWSRGVDCSVFTPARRSDRLRSQLAPRGRCLLLYVGRIAAEKKLPVLIDAFAPLRARLGETVQLIVAGDGPLRVDLERRRDPGVTWLGYVTGERLAELYASCDVFAFPSDTETFGNVVLEAAASGLPGVVVNKGGVTETIRHLKTGLIAEPGNPHALRAALQQLIMDERLRAGLAAGARAHAETKSWTAILDDVVAAYGGILRLPTTRVA